MQRDAPPPSFGASAWTYQRTRKALCHLLQPGLIGFYDRIELLEVFATPRGEAPLNVLSVAVLGEGAEQAEPAQEAAFLTPERIRVEGFKDWSFGVSRVFRPVTALNEALASREAGRAWALSGRALAVGPLRPQPPAFVPRDGTVNVPINRLLKNNFWSGSHVFRLTDPEKVRLAPFFADRRRLQALSDAIAPFVPLKLAGLSDFLGDVLIQLPVAVLVANIRTPRDGEELEAAVVWHPSASARRVRVAARMRFDEMLTGAAVSEPFSTAVRLPINGHLHPVEAEIWDEETNVLLAATAPTSTLKRSVLNMRMGLPGPRLFTVPDVSGTRVVARVELAQDLGQSLVGDEPETDADHWRGRRNELEEARRLAETRDFVQYRPAAGERGERERALRDLRYLVDAHGSGGVDLWDPYLTADDLLQTMFWCPHAGVPLRALTDGRDPPMAAAPPGSSNQSFPDRQRATLTRDAGNLEGLRLEYRTRRGPEGWAFHDRFLIFPGGPNGPSAWSLGTSINSLGCAHHILQRVSNAALIAGAFEDLWETLSKPEHRVWRSW